MSRQQVLPTFNQAHLLGLFKYNPATGSLVFRRYVAGSRRQAGHAAGWLTADGRLRVGVNGKSYMATRIIWMMMTGEWPTSEVDHKDADGPKSGWGDRWENLRLASHQQNIANSKVSVTNTSGCRGVRWHKLRRKWQARITVNGGDKHLGIFENKDAAIAARRAAEIAAFGEFAPAPLSRKAPP